MKVVCVCSKCHEHTHEQDTAIEINFHDKKIYYKCIKCGHLNSIVIEKENFKFPKGRMI